MSSSSNKILGTDPFKPEVAVKAGVTVGKIKAWEHDQIMPTDAQWEALEMVLALDSGMRPTMS